MIIWTSTLHIAATYCHGHRWCVAACARLPDDQRGRMVCRVGFAPERAAAMQARVRAFEATLEALVARGEIGFWGPPLDKPDG